MLFELYAIPGYMEHNQVLLQYNRFGEYLEARLRHKKHSIQLIRILWNPVFLRAGCQVTLLREGGNKPPSTLKIYGGGVFIM